MPTMNPTQTTNNVSRRTFLTGAASTVMGVALMGKIAPASESISGGRSRVVVVRDESALDSQSEPQPSVVRRMIDRGVRELTGESSLSRAWAHFVNARDRIAIKSNVGRVATHPLIHHAFLQQWDNLGIDSESVRIWDRNRGGIGCSQVEPRNWSWIPGYADDRLSCAVHEANVLINTPVLKTHPLTQFSGALKNWVGAVTRINRRDDDVAYAIHAHHGAELACINALPPIQRKCALIVVDALQPWVSRNAEADADTSWPYRGLIFGTDPVAVDRVGWEILQNYRNRIGVPVLDVPVSDGEECPVHLRMAAEKYALGICDVSRIEMGVIGWMPDCLL